MLTTMVIGIPGLLAVTDVDPDLSFFTVVIFGITLLVLWVFAWRPIMDGLAKREESITGKIEQAKADSEKSEALLKEYEAKLAAATEEASSILAEARAEATAAKERILSDAREAADQERDRAIADIRAAKDQAVRDLAQRSVDSAVQLAGNLVRQELDAERHASLIQDSLERFGSNN